MEYALASAFRAFAVSVESVAPQDVRPQSSFFCVRWGCSSIPCFKSIEKNWLQVQTEKQV